MKTFTLWFADRTDSGPIFRYVEIQASSLSEAKRAGKGMADGISTWFRGILPNRKS